MYLLLHVKDLSLHLYIYIYIYMTLYHSICIHHVLWPLRVQFLFHGVWLKETSEQVRGLFGTLSMGYDLRVISLLKVELLSWMEVIRV